MTADVRAWCQAGLLYEVEDGVAWLRLNRPAKRNAIDRPMRGALLAAFEEVGEDPQVRAPVITGNGTAFSSGADLTQDGGAIEIPPERRRDDGPNMARDDGLMYGWSRLMERIWRSEKTFIAGVNAPGAAARLGLDPAELRASRPELITVGISGFGQGGPTRGDAPTTCWPRRKRAHARSPARRGGPSNRASPWPTSARACTRCRAFAGRVARLGLAARPDPGSR